MRARGDTLLSVCGGQVLCARLIAIEDSNAVNESDDE